MAKPKTGGSTGTNQYQVRGHAKNPPPKTTPDVNLMDQIPRDAPIKPTPQEGPLPEMRLSSSNNTLGYWVGPQEDLFDLNAPYQRGSVWNVDQRRNLIKSLYMGIPVGHILISHLPYKEGTASYRVVDGKQRVETVQAFCRDEFTIPASWLRSGDLDATDKTDVSWSDLSDRGRRSFKTSTPLPSLDFNAQTEYSGQDAKGVWRTRQQSDSEILAAEATLYELINYSGVAHTEDNRTRARRVAEQPDDYV